MKSWKVAFGLGAACAACCAIPLVGIAGGLAAFGTALMACAAELLPAASVLLATALVLTATWWWRRRQAAQNATCGCSRSCSTDA